MQELVVEIAQAAYQLHFVVFFSQVSAEDREREDVPARRHRAVLDTIPGMVNTCFSYDEDRGEMIEEKADPLRLRRQTLPTREIA